jgi:hypothetical protein
MGMITQATVAHACMPSYPVGRDQEDRGSDPISEKTKKSQKRASGVAQSEGLCSNLRTKKKKKKSGGA